jgi:hypothetical protein
MWKTVILLLLFQDASLCNVQGKAPFGTPACN